MFRGGASRDHARLERFCREDGLVVTTGQQAGLLTGPLLAINKALTAIALAGQLEARLGRPVLPVFWIASEDHDWPEAAVAHLLSPGHSLLEVLANPAEPPADRSVFEVPLGEPTQLMDALTTACPGPGFADDYRERAQRAYASGATLSSGFEMLLDELLGDRGLLLVQAHDPHLKRASAAVLSDALSQAAAIDADLARVGERLRGAGYHEQVARQEGAALLLEALPEGRTRLFVVGDEVQAGDTKRTALPESVQHVRTDPERFSPDALLRPVVEASVFPVLAYAGGPAELAYSAQNGVLYERLAVVRPMMVPRVSATVVEPKARKALVTLGLDVPDVSGPDHIVRTRVARDRVPSDVRLALESLRTTLEAGVEQLRVEALPIDPTLDGPLRQVEGHMRRSVEKAERKVVQAVKRNSTDALAQLERARALLFPGGAPQERVLSVYHYLMRYGPSFLDGLAAAVERAVRIPEPGAVRIPEPGAVRIPDERP